LGDTDLVNMTALQNTIFENDDLYLRVWFDDGTNGIQLLAPDQQLTSVGFTLKAANADTATTAITADDADTVDGLDGADLEESAEIDADIATHALITDDITVDYATSAGDADGSPVDALYVDDDGDNITNPDETLHVGGTARIGDPGTAGADRNP